MNGTRSNIILYTLTGMAALAMPTLFYDGANNNPLLLPSLAPALVAIALLARIAIRQLDAAHNLSEQLNEMIARRNVHHHFVPLPGAPEMNKVGHQLNVLIYTMADSINESRAAASWLDEMPRRIAAPPEPGNKPLASADAR